MIEIKSASFINSAFRVILCKEGYYIERIKDKRRTFIRKILRTFRFNGRIKIVTKSKEEKSFYILHICNDTEKVIAIVTDSNDHIKLMYTVNGMENSINIAKLDSFFNQPESSLTMKDIEYSSVQTSIKTKIQAINAYTQKELSQIFIPIRPTRQNRNCKRWNHEEDVTIKVLLNRGMTIGDIAKILGRSVINVFERLKAINALDYNISNGSITIIVPNKEIAPENEEVISKSKKVTKDTQPKPYSNEKLEIIDRAIITMLTIKAGKTAQEIAFNIGENTNIVNYRLIGYLSDKVWQDKDFKWYLKEEEQD